MTSTSKPKRKIVLFASEIAGLIGKNPYEPIEKCWNKVYQRIVKDGEEILVKNNIKVAKTDQQIIEDITTKNNVNLSVPTFQSRKFATLADLSHDKKKIIAEIETNSTLNESDKKILKKSVESQLQKDFGTKEEKSVTDIAEELIGKPIEKTNRFVMRTLFETPSMEWCVGGRVDGKTSDNEIVEIKNRMRKLFYQVKGYEHIQLMIYLFIHKSNGGYLVEGFKTQKELLTNHNFVKYDEKLFEKDILEKLKDIGNLFDERDGLQNPKFFLDGLKEKITN